MNYYYTSERNAQIVISLLKSHGIRKVIASPGTTNICLVSSMQRDPFFEIFSAPEERSAAYMACGLAAESGEPVVITCTGATASRNYYPGLTEAFYRKLPVLAITCSRRNYRIGHNMDQVTDRTQLPKDVAKMSVQVPLVYDSESEWNDIIMVNKAILELSHRGKGPVHINLETNYSMDYSVKELPKTRAIYRILEKNKFPEIPKGKTAIFVGSHHKWSEELIASVEKFCERHNGVVICDHTSNYTGKYKILASLMAQQSLSKSVILEPIDLLIHIGNVHAPWFKPNPKSVWRVNPDGEICDTFGKLEYVFEMSEENFFTNYENDNGNNLSFYNTCKQEFDQVKKLLDNNIESLPFSNAWVASQTISILPPKSALHFGIQNSLRFWNFFELPNSISGWCNVGGFGIDGSMSSLLGASLADKEKLFYCVLGDLAFFYDLNSLGNRHVGNNLRIVLINNGKGTEFKLSKNPGHLFGNDTDKYIAAGGHYGNKSSDLVRHYAEDLGFEYLSASSKAELLSVIKRFVTPELTSKPMILELFTESENEDQALTQITELVKTSKGLVSKVAKDAAKNILGNKGYNSLKNMMKKK